jgi:aspartate carbamoyltransferase catalytic subunit
LTILLKASCDDADRRGALVADDINHVLDLADGYVELNRRAEKKRGLLRGRTIINCFFENSTRTRTSFEVAGKRLGRDRQKSSLFGPHRCSCGTFFN